MRGPAGGATRPKKDRRREEEDEHAVQAKRATARGVALVRRGDDKAVAESINLAALKPSHKLI